MEKLLNLLQTVKKFNQKKFLKQAVKNKDLKKQILDLNRFDQLYNLGEDANGEDLVPSYAYNTIVGVPGRYEGKIAKGQPFDRVTLNDKGNFYNSFDLKFNNDELEITADDINDLAIKYGTDILGLNDENLEESFGFIRAFILQQIREQILIQ